MQFPIGTTFERWTLATEVQKGKTVFVIRRWAHLPDDSKKYERLPVAKYKSIRNDETELKLLVIRLNEQSKEVRTKEAVEIKHAFISPEMLDNYKKYLLAQIPTRSKALSEFSYLKNYFLGFFIAKKNIPDPLVWHKIHKADWADYLLSDEVSKGDKKKKLKGAASANVKQAIVLAANRFMDWLHNQRPAEVPPLLFKPFTKSMLKKVEAKREMNHEVHKTKYIKDADWKVILENASEKLKPYAVVSYFYGLRRSETLGLKLDDVKKGYLSVERQLEKIPDEKPVFDTLKGREFRQVPHWFCTPSDAYSNISQIINSRVHPDTLTDLWMDLMLELGMDYTFHDIRHTWITRAMRHQKVPRDVQLAAGHKNIETTMGYLHDDRELKDEVFVPEGA